MVSRLLWHAAQSMHWLGTPPIRTSSDLGLYGMVRCQLQSQALQCWHTLSGCPRHPGRHPHWTHPASGAIHAGGVAVAPGSGAPRVVPRTRSSSATAPVARSTGGTQVPSESMPSPVAWVISL